jgi:3-oxoacyl-[acyl-carrier-protein] synthase-3
MTSVFVNNLSYSLGDITNTVEEAVKAGLTLSEASSFREAGFSFHHRCSPEKNSYDLAKDCVEKIRTNLGDVGALIYSTCIPANAAMTNNRFVYSRDIKDLMDFPASHLQQEFNLERASVLGLSQQACTGMLGSLRLARSLLLTETDVQRVLCVSADRFPEGAIYEQSYNLISDGASACIVSLEPHGYKLIASHAVTNGSLATASDDEAVGTFFNYAHHVILETLRKAALTMQEIHHVAAQNMNPSAWKILARLLQYDYNRVHAPTLAEIGHVISGDNIINLKHMENSGVINAGERVLLFMAGYGLNWQCVILEKVR